MLFVAMFALAEHGKLLRHETGKLREQIELLRHDALKRVRVWSNLCRSRDWRGFDRCGKVLRLARGQGAR